MKKRLVLILVIVIVIGLFVFAAYTISSENNPSTSTSSVNTPTEPALKDEFGVGYRINDDNTLAVTTYDGKDKDVCIDTEFENKSVKNIAQSAFKGMDIVSVTMPDGLKSIDGFAFALCNKLNLVNIPDSVTEIGNNAFFLTNALTEIELPKELETIGVNAFNASAIEEIIIPKKVKSIGDYAFANCSNLKKITVFGKDTKVASSAFDTKTKTTIIAPKGSPAIKVAKKQKLKYTEK